MSNGNLGDQKMLHRKRIIILQLILLFVPGVVYGKKVTAEEIREKVTVRRPYTLNTETEFTLSEGEAVQLNCSDNPYVKEYLLYPSPDGQMWMCYFGPVSNLIGNNSSSFKRLEGALRQVGHTPCLAIAKWQLKDEEIIIKFCISSDKDYNQREYEQWQKTGRGKMSLGLKGWEAVQPPKLTELERLTGFIKLWSEVKYNFAFFDQVPDLDWDAVLEEYLPKVQQAQSVAEYYRVLKRCISLLRDGHTAVSGPSGEPICCPPLRVRAIDGRAVIVEIYPAENIKNPEIKEELLRANLKLGEEITSVDGRTVKQILEDDIYPYIFASTPQWCDLVAYPKIVKGKYRTKAVLRIKGLDGAQREVTLTRDEYRLRRRRTFVFRELDDGIVYVNLPSFGSDAIVEDFDAVFNKISKAKGLILDVRKNGGGNSAYGDEIISYLTDKPIEGTRWKTRQYMPAFRAWGEQEKWYQGDHQIIEPRKEGSFTGPIVILTGSSTFSAAEDFVVPLHASGRATVVGEKTAGSTGQPLFIELPSGGARICTKWDTYPDGREFVGVGVIPDVEVHPTPADIAAGKDVVLEKGLEVLSSKIK